MGAKTIEQQAAVLTGVLHTSASQLNKRNVLKQEFSGETGTSLKTWMRELNCMFRGKVFVDGCFVLEIEERC